MKEESVAKNSSNVSGIKTSSSGKNLRKLPVGRDLS